jgi:hypothetical protein
MALEPEDAIPAEFLPEPVAAPQEEKTAKMSGATFAALVGIPWIVAGGWLEWDNVHTGWVSALLLSGFGFAASGYLRGKIADAPRLILMFSGLGFYVYGVVTIHRVVTADSVSVRVWLGLWLFVAFILFGNALPQSETPTPQHEPRDRGPEELS